MIIRPTTCNMSPDSFTRYQAFQIKFISDCSFQIKFTASVLVSDVSITGLGNT